MKTAFAEMRKGKRWLFAKTPFSPKKAPHAAVPLCIMDYVREGGQTRKAGGKMFEFLGNALAGAWDLFWLIVFAPLIITLLAMNRK